MENLTQAPLIAKKGTFPATIVKVINDFQIVINKGKDDGIRQGQRVLIYNLSDDEIIDQNTGESLGYLEIVKGTGRVIHLQEKMATIESDRTKYIKKSYKPTKYSVFVPLEEIEEAQIIPFDNPEIGDKIKPI